jgi:hypothetical protein
VARTYLSVSYSATLVARTFLSVPYSATLVARTYLSVQTVCSVGVPPTALQLGQDCPSHIFMLGRDAQATALGQDGPSNNQSTYS